jgi:hypothetical protein
VGCAALRRAESGYPRSFGRTATVSDGSGLQLYTGSPSWVLFRGDVVYHRVELRRDMMQPVDLAAGAPRSKLLPAVFPLQLYTRLFHLPRHHFTVPIMSRASQITLATTCVTAIGTVAFVHWSQKADKAVGTLNLTWSRKCLTCIRQCIWASSATSNSSESSESGRPTSRCRGNSRRNI